MGLMDMLDNLADSRRRKQLDGLRARSQQLAQEFGAAVAAGDDALADKLHAQREKVQADVRAVEAALAEQQRQASAKARADDAAERQRLRETAKVALEHLKAEAIRFDELVLGEVIAQWGQVEEAHRAARQALAAIGEELPGYTLALPRTLWNRTWVRFGQALPIDIPRPAPASKSIASVADALAQINVPTKEIA